MDREILNKRDIERIISRIAHEIIEKNKGCEGMLFIGIQRGGVNIANRLSKKIREIEDTDIPVGSLDIAFYRDDLDMRDDYPMARKTEIPFDITDEKIILVDDVLFTGRSIRAAMDALMDFGRPAQIQLAVLIDRGHRELPIRADYVGKNTPTSRSEIIQVILEDKDGNDRVCLKT